MSIKIENTQVFGWEAAIRGARNPMNSWDKSDSWFNFENWYESKVSEELTWDGPLEGDWCESEWQCENLLLGPNDHKLLMNLCKGGTEESKWRRMIHVQMDITAPLYWWKEFETYKVGTVSNSCSTMHKIHAKEFTLDDFSCEHLFDAKMLDDEDPANELGILLSEITMEERSKQALDENIETNSCLQPLDILKANILMLNECRHFYMETKNKLYWWQMIQLLPSSYNQRRTIDLNYEVLASQYQQRKDHKLDEWHQYCDWIKTLPYSEFITMEDAA